MAYPNDDFLVETAWLESHLSDPDLRVVDCRIHFAADDDGGIVFTSAEPDWVDGHIPRALHVDLQGELSDPSSDLPFMLPGADAFAEVASQLGIGDGVRVVLYDGFFNIWAARMWWMLRAFGFSNAAVLNGGFTKWTLEDRALSTGRESVEPGSFVSRPARRVFVDKDAVLTGIPDDRTRIVDALYEAHYTGESPIWVARPGHIESATNLPFDALVDTTTHAYLAPDALRAALGDLASSDHSVITYCHAGNAASSVAFALALMGRDDVSIYDGSLCEWSVDPALPMATSADE